MVLSYTHPYTNTVRQSRTGTRLCVPFRQSLLSADGPLMAPQLATKSVPLQLAAMPLTLSHPEERRQLRGTPTPLCIYIWYVILLCPYMHVFSFLSNSLCFKTDKEKLSPNHLKKTIDKHVALWTSGLKWIERGAACLSEVFCTLTHTHTHTYKHMSQPLPLTPSCTAA